MNAFARFSAALVQSQHRLLPRPPASDFLFSGRGTPRQAQADAHRMHSRLRAGTAAEKRRA